MLELFTSALATDGLVWIAIGTLIAGLVRGFAGFGTGMIYLPVASQFLGPIEAMVTLVFVDCLGPLVAIPRAVRESDWPDLRTLLIGLLIGMPFGIWLLLSIPAETFRLSISIVSLLLLAALIFGVRYTGRLSRNKVFGVGGAAGVLGGAVGLPGPPVILFYMASTHPAHVIRATTMLFLFSFEIILLGMLGFKGLLTLSGMIIGLTLVPAMLIGTLIGTWLFNPEYEKIYRIAAYIVIAVSAIRGLPIWG